MKKKLALSIVCASHKGREKIPDLIESIYQNTYWPKEIIICGTSRNDFDLINIKKYRKLKIKKLVSKIKSQKYQRKKAQNCAQNNIILQLDDDLILKKNFIELMFSHFKNSNEKKVVCALILIKTKKKNQSLNLIDGIIKFYSIRPSGRICPLLPKNFYNSKKVISGIEWTPSTICYEKSAIKDAVSNIDLKEKKSYYEDVIFSHSLYNNGYKLLIDTNIIAYHPEFESLNIKEHLKTLKAQFFIVRNFKKNYILFLLDILFSTFYLLIKKILKN